MIATPVTIQQHANGPRPINLSRDTYAVLQLLDLVFGPILDARGRRLVSERVSLSHTPPLRLRMAMITQGFVPGFVWEEAGRLVGNLSLIQANTADRYLIANVAVHPDFRRRGIARGLLEQAMSHVVDQGGREIWLQVEHDNQGAIDLYRQYNFTSLGLINRWQSTLRRLRPIEPDTLRSHDLRELRRSDWRRAYRLDRAGLASELNWPDPPAAYKYRRGLLARLADFLNGRRRETWVAYPRGGDDSQLILPGLVDISGTSNRRLKLELRVHPHWQGALERPLLAKALRRIGHSRGTSVRVDHPADDEAVNTVLEEANLKRARTLRIMRAKTTKD